MDLILWRHADAEDRRPDAARALTSRGLQQAAKVARWLNERLPDHIEILASPALRAQQTAQALNRSFHTRAELAVGESAADLLRAAGWPDKLNRCVLVVGHQPTLGEVAAYLLEDAEAEWLAKGAVRWLSSAGEQAVLKIAITPEQIGDPKPDR